MNKRSLWGTYYGEGGDEFVNGFTTCSSNNELICGYTTSGAGNVSGGWDNVYVANKERLIVKFNTLGARIWATYYEGTNDEIASCIANDAFGDIKLCRIIAMKPVFQLPVN